MTLTHSHAGPTVAAASLVVALIVASLNPVAWALETDDSVDDEEQEVDADTSDEVDVEETDSTDGETTTSDGEATTADAETVEESVDTATEPTADPEATTEPELEPEPAPEPDAELEPAPEPDGELEPAPESGPDAELEPDEELEPDPEPDSELEPDPEPGSELGPDADDETVSESTSEVEETVESDDDSESDSEPEPSSDESPSESSEPSSTSTSSTSGSAPSSDSEATDEGPSRSASLEPQPADQADDDAVPALAPDEGRWPKRTVEAAGEPVRPIATDGLSGEELAALKGTETTDAAPGAGDNGVRAPMVAGPGQRIGESVAAPAAAERDLIDRTASVLGGAVPAYELPGVPSAAAMPVWVMLTAVALLLVVVAGHLRWTPDHYWATVGAAVRPRSRFGAGR